MITPRVAVHSATVRRLLILFPVVVAVATIVSNSSAEPIYRVVDEQGRVIYTDSPPSHEKSEQIKLPKTNTQPAVVPRPQLDKGTSIATSDARYSTIAITQPVENATIPPGQLDVIIQIELVPQLQPGHLIKLYHNNVPIGMPEAATSYSLGNLFRGQHQVRAEILNANGKMVAKTQTVTFHVKRYRPKN
jgi:hypothetical protein